MFNPALFKLFDEGIVNCRDHVIRMQQKSKKTLKIIFIQLQINVEIKNDIITLYNTETEDIEKHPEYNLWIPEMIFASSYIYKL